MSQIPVVSDNSISLMDDNLQKWIDVFLLDRRSQNNAKGTIDFYKCKLQVFYNFCQKVKIEKVLQIEPSHIRNFLIFLQENGHNSGGVHSFFRSIKVFLRWFENEYEPENWKNPIQNIKAPKNPTKLLDPVNIDDVQKMIDFCPKNDFFGIRDKAIFLCLLDTGLRAQELLSINIRDVDFFSGEIHILEGKGRKKRLVFLGSKSRKAFRAYLRIRTDVKDALWLNKSRDRLQYWGLVAMINRRAKEAKVPPPSLHSFRRWFALTCLRAGMDVFSLQELMGHSDLQVLKRYLKQASIDLQNAHRKASPVDSLFT